MNIFIKNPNLKKKNTFFFFGGGGGAGGRGVRGLEKSKIKKNWGGGG